MTLASRDRFGARRVVYTADGAFAASCRALKAQTSLGSLEIDAEAIHTHLGGAPLSDRTLFKGIAQLSPGQSLSRSTQGAAIVSDVREIASITASSDLETLLTHAIEETLAQTQRVALALSGGLDSALVLACLRALGATHVTAYVLDAALKGYSERDAALRTAEAIGCQVKVVKVHETDFVDALSDTTAVVEEPLYNAHPVAKFLLARAMHRDGVEVAISGDGADQVMKRDTRADYLPLAHALFAANHVTLRSPFLNEHVVAHLCALPADPHKAVLRELGARLGVPRALVTHQKVSRLAPPIPLEGLVSRLEIANLAKRLGQDAPQFEDDRAKMRWYTLALTLKSFDVAF